MATYIWVSIGSYYGVGQDQASNWTIIDISEAMWHSPEGNYSEISQQYIIKIS